jgi:HicB family
MDLTSYLDALRRDLAAAAAPGGPDVTRAADLLGGSLEASARLCLLEALSDASAEITSKLGTANVPAAVEVRLRGREAQFVVTSQAAAEPAAQPTDAESTTGAPAGPPIDESGDVSRITLRLPEALKAAVEQAAAAEGISVNAWLVRAVGTAVAGRHVPPSPPPTPGRTGRRVTGFAQA